MIKGENFLEGDSSKEGLQAAGGLVFLEAPDNLHDGDCRHGEDALALTIAGGVLRDSRI
jgi:hypothetical protein